MDARDHERGHFSSSWVMVARKPQYLAHLKKAPGQDEKFWSTPDPVNKKYLWTDKGENSFRGVYYADPTIGEFGRSVYQAEDFLRRRGVFPNQINRWMQPVYGMIQSWATARADALNRDTPKPKEPTKR